MTTYVITFEPCKNLFDIITDLKNSAKEEVGNQLYLLDPPHMTLYIANLEEVEEWSKELESIANNLKENREETNKNPTVPMHTKQWLAFENDTITGKNALTISIDKKDSELLKKIQKQVVEKLSKYRKSDIIERYNNISSNLNDIKKINLENYGYPFVGDDWIPHISIGSFDNESYKLVSKKLKDKCPIGFYSISAFHIYKLNEKTDEITSVKKIPISY